MSGSRLLSRKLIDIQNRDDFRIVLISSDGAPTELVDFDDHLKKYESCEVCEDYIKKVESDRKFLVIFKDSIPETDFENLNQIRSIYILLEKKNLDYNSTNHPKVIGSFKDIHTLIDRLCKEVILICRSDLPMSISPIYEMENDQSLTKLDGNSLTFLWDQLFNYYLVHPIEPNMKQLKKDMLEQCKLDYKDNPAQLNKIESFDKECSDQNAGKWYTKDSFLYRIFNKAFRTRNIDIMCKFQYFIVLLYKNFELLSKSRDKNLSVAYRGQNMRIDELKKLKSNVGNLISINSILSTSCNKESAHSFVPEPEGAVIFKINIPKQNNDSFKPFIDMSEVSTMEFEEEVIFFMGAVFSIDSIQNQPDAPCIVELTLNNDLFNHFRKLMSVVGLEAPNMGDMYLSILKIDNYHIIFQPLIDQIINSFMQEIQKGHGSIMKTDDFNMIQQYYYLHTGEQISSNNNPTIIIYTHFAFFFSNLGLYDRAIHIYKQALLLENISTRPEFIIIHIIIGYLYYHSSKYDDASMHYAIALSLLGEDKLLICEIYARLAEIQKKRGNVDTALSYYQDALRIANNRYIPSLFYIYQEIINTLETQGNANAANVYKTQSIEIDPDKYYISLSTSNAPEILDDCRLNNEKDPIKRAHLLYKMGISYVTQGNFDKALEHLLQAKDLYTSQPPSWDHFYLYLPILFDNIATIYLFSKDYFKALVTWRKSIDIRLNFRP